MMTSTFPSSRGSSLSNYSLKDGLKEIQSKKEVLVALEKALNKRVSELKELCLKEGELTGHLPIDYPLQPREPIPQIRRRINYHSNNNNNNDNNLNDNSDNSILGPISGSRQHNKQQPPSSSSSSSSSNGHKLELDAPSNNKSAALNAISSMPFPSRPTSTNSTSSSISTASSNNRTNTNQQHQLSSQHHILNSTSIASSSNPSSLNQQQTSYKSNFNHHHIQRNPLLTGNRPNHLSMQLPPHHFKRPFNLDNDPINHIRASSTASSSSSSSSGSAASSTMSASTVPNVKTSGNYLQNMNLHTRSCSESLTGNQHSSSSLQSNNAMHLLQPSRNYQETQTQLRQLFDQQPTSTTNNNHLDNNTMAHQPDRPPRGNATNNSSNDVSNRVGLTYLVQGTKISTQSLQQLSDNKMVVNSIAAPISAQLQKSMELGKDFSINGVVENFQPFYEETKPFQMSDFYKYSSKHRQKDNHEPPQINKTTRQLQNDILRSKNSLRFASCDEQIQASVKLIEKSGQKLIEATAKAIAGNPGLAEKLNNILPNNGERY